jgi:CheY-like chemotaxis protein
MKTKAPVIFIDDDMEDLQILSDAMEAIGAKNELVCFHDSTEAIGYLRGNKRPLFFILCDINMPKMDGISLRKAMVGDMPFLLGATPFMYLSTARVPETINMVYGLNIQGYFTKPSTFDGMVEMLKSIISYWTIAIPPVTF